MFGFITRDLSYGIVYNGDVSDVDYCVDDSDAVTRYSSLKSVRREKVSIVIYGKEMEFSLPIYAGSKKKYKYLNEEFSDYMVNVAGQRILPDKVLGVWQKTLAMYEVVGVDGSICFLEKEDKGDSLSLRDNVAKGFSVAQREMILGYVRTKPHIIQTPEGKKEMRLHTTLRSPDNSIVVPYNYTVGLRNAMFGEEKKRRGLAGLLQERQYKVLEMQGHMTYVAAPRRAGKTFLAGFVAIREIMAEKFSMTNEYRPTTVIYIGLTKTKNLKVVDYMKAMARSFMKGESKDTPNMFHWDGQNQIFSFRSGKRTIGNVNFISQEMKDPGIGDFADLIIIDEAWIIRKDIFDGVLPIVLGEKAKLFCISTLYADSLKGRFFDRLIKSETVSEEHNVEKTKEYRDAISKLKLALGPDDGPPNIQKNPKYKKVVENQNAYHKIYRNFLNDLPSVGFRFTLDDIEHMDEEDKRSMREDDNYKNDELRYMAELYSRFPDEGRVLDYERVLVKPEKVFAQSYDSITIGYDSALTMDKPGLVAVGRHGGLGKFAVLHADYLEGFRKIEDHYGPIISLMDDMKEYLIDGGGMYFAMDGTQKANVEVLQMKGLNVDLRVAYTSGNEVNQSSKIWNELKIPKKVLVNTSETVFNGSNIYVPTSMKKLSQELDAFQRIPTNSGNIKYEAITGNDDIVNALMIAIYHQYEHLNNKFYMHLEERQNRQKIRNIYKAGGEELQKAEQALREAKEKHLSLSNKYFSKFGY